MAKLIQDIKKKLEKPQDPENVIQPEKQEIPAPLEIEKKYEAMPSPEVKVEKIEEALKAVMPTPTMAAPAGAIPIKSPVLEKIEDVLEEDLEDIYFQMPAEKQAAFKEVGEVTASKIAVLLGTVKVQVKKILSLIIEWLRIIPHVNKYFLEQEAKIKTDKLLDLKEQGEIPSAENQNKIYK